MLYNLMKNLVPRDSEHVTIELREVVKDTDIFDRCDPFPIWDEKDRGELEKKIIEHYYFRQIGFETVGRFKFYLNTTLREIMPYYIKLWKTTQYQYNPIENYRMDESGKDTVKSSADTLSKFNDTPMGEVDSLLDGKYLTNATHGTDNSSSEQKHEFMRKGNIGVTTTQTMIKQEREITIDVMRMIINQLNDLFIGVY